MIRQPANRLRPRPLVPVPLRPTERRPLPDASWPIRDEVLTFHDVPLDSGDRLATLDVHYRLEGEIAPARDNVVLIIHALTGTVRATEWWRGVVEAGGAIDPTKHAVLTANLLGGCDGTTGPTNEDPDVLPPITTRDQAAVLARLLDALGVSAPLLVCGGSLGGQVTLEFAASFPSRTQAAVVLAAPAAQTAQGLAWNTIMRRAIALGGVHDGLALARMVGMLSYRTPEALERRFGRARSANDTYLVNQWLDVHGEKLVGRFDATSYGALIDAMDTHDVGRDRGGIAAALAPVADRLTGVGIPGDLLYPADTVREWAQSVQAQYIDLPSVHGHDAFLLETARVSEILRTAIAQADSRRAPRGAMRRETPEAATQPATRVRTVASEAPTNASATRPLRIALAGCGHVGGSLLDLFGERGATSDTLCVQRVLVRDARRARPALAQAIARGLAPAQATIADPTELLDDDVDVLVEAIGGTTTARTLVETALRRGIRVVTANKALLAERGPQLQQLAEANGTRLDFEGAVAGAVPIVRCVRSGAAGVGITAFSGILNGTSNFVLDRVAEGVSLADAIRTAQQLGFAEADPTRDLSGEDAEDKLRVLSWLIFGIAPAALTVVRRGIDEETAAWAAHAATEGDRVKLIASCAREQGTLVARIIPTRVTRDDPWAAVSGPNNRIVIESASAGALAFHGPGAGGRATAGAVLSDVLSSRAADATGPRSGAGR
jgi:homoserine O-acetyltransferase